VETLSASEQQIAALKAELVELKGALETSDVSSIGTSEAAKAVNLAQDIESQLLTTSTADGKLPALSRMKKADLVVQCRERELDYDGTVPELRARLRTERMRDKSVAVLVKKGWSEREARVTLTAVGWDVDAAIEKKKER
jgi:hypothetical protein